MSLFTTSSPTSSPTSCGVSASFVFCFVIFTELLDDCLLRVFPTPFSVPFWRPFLDWTDERRELVFELRLDSGLEPLSSLTDSWLDFCEPLLDSFRCFGVLLSPIDCWDIVLEKRLEVFVDTLLATDERRDCVCDSGLVSLTPLFSSLWLTFSLSGPLASFVFIRTWFSLISCLSSSPAVTPIDSSLVLMFVWFWVCFESFSSFSSQFTPIVSLFISSLVSVVSSVSDLSFVWLICCDNSRLCCPFRALASMSALVSSLSIIAVSLISWALIWSPLGMDWLSGSSSGFWLVWSKTWLSLIISTLFSSLLTVSCVSLSSFSSSITICWSTVSCCPSSLSSTTGSLFPGYVASVCWTSSSTLSSVLSLTVWSSSGTTSACVATTDKTSSSLSFWLICSLCSTSSSGGAVGKGLDVESTAVSPVVCSVILLSISDSSVFSVWFWLYSSPVVSSDLRAGNLLLGIVTAVTDEISLPLVSDLLLLLGSTAESLTSLLLTSVALIAAVLLFLGTGLAIVLETGFIRGLLCFLFDSLLSIIFCSRILWLLLLFTFSPFNGFPFNGDTKS